IETQKPLVKDEEASDVDVHLYRSMIGCLQSVLVLGFRVSLFNLEAYSDSDYARANLDRKSTTREAEYVAAANCCGQVLWIQNQMLDYGFSFMNTKIYIDNESTICIVKNPIYHSKIKHIAIRHHFIRDAYKKKLIPVLKIHTNNNVADLLTKAFDVSSSIHNALTVSLVVSTTFVEIINNVRHITANVVGKPVSISKASIRSDLLFDDANGIDSLPNQAIFDAIQLMGYERDLTVLTFNKALFSPQWSKANVEPQSELSPRSSLSAHIPDSIPERSGGNHGGQSPSNKSVSGNEDNMILQSVYDLCISLCTQVTDQAKEIKHLKAQIKKLKKKDKPVITHHKAWMKSVSLKKSLARKKSKESVSKQGRKSAKVEPSVPKDPLFDELPNDTMDCIDIEDAQDVGRTRDVVNKEKESAEDAVSTEGVVSTDRQNVSTDKPNVSTDRPKVNTDKEDNSTVSPDEGTDDRTDERSAIATTPTTTPTMFGDDETIAQVLLNMNQVKAVSREKEKGVALKDVEESKRPRPTSTRSLLTLKPLPKIDPKDKGKKKIEEEDESDTESEGIPEAEKMFKQLARDEEMARKVQEDWEAEEEVKKLAEEEAIKTALSNEYDFIQERIEADRLLALRLQDEEREQFIMEERAMFLHDSIAAQRRFLAEQRKHSDQKSKTFEEIQALYEKVKRFDESFTAVGSTKDGSDDSFIAIGSAEDEKVIKEMNEQVADASKKRKMKSKKRKFTSKDDEELRLCLTIVSDEDKEVDYEILDKKYPIIEWRSKYLTTKPQYDGLKR
ncbi:hypothetical protein Tco_0963818, partial [Tanacetum coccineum]